MCSIISVKEISSCTHLQGSCYINRRGKLKDIITCMNTKCPGKHVDLRRKKSLNYNTTKNFVFYTNNMAVLHLECSLHSEQHISRKPFCIRTLETVKSLVAQRSIETRRYAVLAGSRWQICRPIVIKSNKLIPFIQLNINLCYIKKSQIKI
jgi:hypothetical protein